MDAANKQGAVSSQVWCGCGQEFNEAWLKDYDCNLGGFNYYEMLYTQCQATDTGSDSNTSAPSTDDDNKKADDHSDATTVCLEGKCSKQGKEFNDCVMKQLADKV